MGTTLRSATATVVLSLALLTLDRAHAQPASSATAARPDSPKRDAEVTSLIAKLSSEDWRERTKAQAELSALGEVAEPHLLERLKQNPDPETRTLIEAVLSSITRARQLAPATVTLRLDNASPRQAFAALAEQSQVAFAPGWESLLNTIDKRFDVNLDRTPMWESMLKLGADSGVAFNSVDSEGQIVLEALPANGAVAAPPAAAAGPFLVTINHIETNVSKAVAFAGKRPLNARQNQFNNPPCRVFFFAWGEPRLKPIRWFIDSIDECVTDTGHDMRSAAAGAAPQQVWRPSSGGVNGPMETMFSLAAPDPAARRIARLAMTARFVLQKRTHTLQIPNVLGVKNATHFIGGFRLVIKDVNKVTDGRYAYELSLYRDNRSQADWELFRAMLDRYRCRIVDADGNELSMTGGSSSSRPDQMTMSNTLTTEARNGGAIGEPAKLVWEFPEEVQQVTVALVFRDVPLP